MKIMSTPIQWINHDAKIVNNDDDSDRIIRILLTTSMRACQSCYRNSAINNINTQGEWEAMTTFYSRNFIFKK